MAEVGRTTSDRSRSAPTRDRAPSASSPESAGGVLDAATEQLAAGAGGVTTGAGASGSGGGESRHAALLRDARLSSATSSPQRIRLLQRLQHGYGNGYVARVINTIQRECAPPPVEKPKLEPLQDPKFKQVKSKVKQVEAKEKEHAPTSKKVAEAQGAAVPPGNDVASQAAAAQVDKMGEQKPGEFDKKAFIAAVRKAIDAATPKNMEETEEFKESGKAAKVKDEVGGLVKGGKGESEKAIKDATQAPPDASKATPKPVTPMPEEKAGAPPGDVGAAKAMPDKKAPEEVSLANGPCELNSQMSDAKVTEEQLKKSKEPDFEGALEAKKETEANAKAAPAQYRAAEQQTLGASKAEAAKDAASAVAGMHTAKAGATSKVGADKSGAKVKDEAERAKVAAEIEGIYNAAKTDVTKILSELDPAVDKAFESGEKAARDDFENYVATKMAKFKDERYSGIDGAAQWVVDKLTSPPPEVNRFIDEGRARYMSKMDGVISDVADIVARELTRAKTRIAEGRQKVKDYVSGLPKSLKAAGDEAAAKIESQFDELESEVKDKGDGLVQSLADKYVAARTALDERVNAMKEENKGLLDKAKDAVKGVVDTILNLKDMLLGVLSKAGDVIDKIIADPIGFLGNLVSAIKQGLNGFISNIGKHLKAGLMGWLFGELGEAGITMPETFDFKGILSLVLQVLGLTWANLRAQLVKLVGPEIVEGIEKGVAIFQKVAGIFQKIMTEGVGALWELVQDKLSDLKEQILGKIEDFLIVKVITAGITWLISLLNPASAFVKACKMIYDVVMYFINNGSRIMSLVNAILDGIGAIASGQLSGAAKLVEDSLAKALPMAISFLASLLGLGGLGEKIKEIITAVRTPVNKAISAVIGPLVKPLKKLWEKGKGWVKKQTDKVKAKVDQAKQWGMKKFDQAKTWAKGKMDQVKGKVKGMFGSKAGEADKKDEKAKPDPNERTPDQKAHAVTQALTEGDQLFASGKSEDEIKSALPAIKVTHGLTSMTLVVDDSSDENGKVHLEAAASPGKPGPTHLRPPTGKRPKWRSDTRDLIAKQDGVTNSTCPYCHTYREVKEMHIEHVVPWATLKAMHPAGSAFRKTRADEINLYHYWDGSAPKHPHVNNLTLACPKCNIWKSNIPLKDWQGGKYLH
jgi:hypothetical protein